MKDTERGQMTYIIRDVYRRGGMYSDVADALLAAGFGDVAAAKAQALREAADAPVSGNLVGPRPPSVRHWLRHRADQIEAGR